jgi:hypothetical protein
VTYIDQKALFDLARSKRPANPSNTVSSFSGWVFNLYMPSSPSSMKAGKLSEFEIEREGRDLRLSQQPAPISSDFELEFADPLDRSQSPFKISSLTLKSQPIWGIPDVVYRHKMTGEIIIFERKVTFARPNEWPNLKVQLWCYGKIDKWKSAPKISLLGSIYSPKYDLKHAVFVGPWHRDDFVFDSESRQLFELFGGKITD